MLSGLRRWLNVRTWDKSHVPLEDEQKAYDQYRAVELRASMPTKSPELVEKYIEIDRAIRHGEVDGIEAMTDFFCGKEINYSASLEKPDHSMRLFSEDNDEMHAAAWQGRRYVIDDKIGNKERVRSGSPPRTYEYPITGEEHKALAPKSALLMPVKLGWGEQEAKKILQTLKPVLEEPLKLKPEVEKKFQDSEKQAYRVYWTDKGKMKKVKET